MSMRFGRWKWMLWLWALGITFSIPAFSVPMDSSFFTNATVAVHPRFYYLNRHFDTPHTQ